MMRVETKYLISIVVSALFAVCFALLFNLLVDPYGAYRLFNIPGVNIIKPSEVLNKSQSKVRAVVKLKPETLILGTSRAELGMDPAHKVLVEENTPVYNMALPASNIVQHLKILKFVHNNHALKRVVLGLDFSMFNASRFANNKINVRLEHALKEQGSFSGVEHFNNLLTYEAFTDSYKTLKSQNNSEEDQRKRTNENGLRNPSAWLRTFDAVGHKEMFSRTERRFFRRGVYRSGSGDYFGSDSLRVGWLEKMGLAGERGKKANSLDTFSELLEFCAENQIELKLFISPLHARHQNIIVAENRWKDFELWKRRLTKAVYDMNRKHDVGYVLWDFSLYSNVTTEAVPNDPKAEMRWYWESEHYKKALGDRIIDIVFSRTAVSVVDETLGVALTVDNLDQHLGSIRAAQESYVKLHPGDKGRLRRLKVLVTGDE